MFSSSPFPSVAMQVGENQELRLRLWVHSNALLTALCGALCGTLRGALYDVRCAVRRAVRCVVRCAPHRASGDNEEGNCE